MKGDSIVILDVPKFDTVGIFFSEDFQKKFYWDHHQRPREDKRDHLERTLDYMANKIGFNFITYMTSSHENIPLVAKYFPKIALGAGGGNPPTLLEELPEFPGVDAEFYFHIDEPELAPMDMGNLNEHITRWINQGHRPILNFCGLRRNRNDIQYAKEYLSRYDLSYTSIDLYPSYYDGTDWDFALNYLKEIRPYVKGKFIAIIQAFGKPGVWRYPTTDEIVRLAWECKNQGVEWLEFFLWNSCYTGPGGYDELLTGLDVLPVEYHELIARMRK